MSGYVLTASVFHRTEGGRRVRYRRGDELVGLSAADVARLTEAGAIAAKGSDAGKAAIEAPGDEPTAAPELPEPGPDQVTQIVAAGNINRPARPKAAQSVEVWREYAVAAGFTEQEAEAMTKKQIQDATR